MKIIEVNNLKKSFNYPIKSGNYLKDFFNTKYKEVCAINNISFSVNKSERLAFIGKNGAGKSTTIKMLTGIIHPDEGEIKVLGLNPIYNRKELAYKIGTVFGQRSQLYPNLPISDSLEYFAKMYDLDDLTTKKNIAQLINLFELGDFSQQAARKLSLGQRMRAEISCALVHNPEIIFLDEPTIGLDVVAKNNLRKLLLIINKELGTTIFLTSHDVGDIEFLCERTLIINDGQILADLPTKDLNKNFINEKEIEIQYKTNIENIIEIQGTKIKKEDNKIKIKVNLEANNLNDVINYFLSLGEIEDLNVNSPDLEKIIRRIYAKF